MSVWSSSTARFRWGISRTSARNSSESSEMSGFWSPAASNTSMTPSGRDRARHDLPDGVVRGPPRACSSPRSIFARAAFTVWKNATSSRASSASGRGTESANAFDSSTTAWTSRSLPSSCARTCSWAAGRTASRSVAVPSMKSRVVEAVEDVAADLELLQHDGDGLVLVDRGCALAAAVGVDGESLPQIVGDPQVVDDQPAGLVPEDSVHARDRLHQPVAAHRLVDVHRVQARRVEAREPHVSDDDNLERVRRGP